MRLFTVLYDNETESNFLPSFSPIIIFTTPSQLQIACFLQLHEFSFALLFGKKQHTKSAQLTYLLL